MQAETVFAAGFMYSLMKKPININTANSSMSLHNVLIVIPLLLFLLIFYTVMISFRYNKV